MGELVGYARVSTLDQDPQLQLDALKAAGCQRIHTDRVSGAKASRPELDAALAYVREGDTLVVWKLDRLGRSLKHLIETIECLAECGVAFRSLTDGIDTSTAAGRMLFHVIGAIAQFERDLIRERTHAGLAVARARGRVGGAPPKMTAKRRRVAQAMYDEVGDDGRRVHTVQEIADVIGVSRGTIYRHLDR